MRHKPNQPLKDKQDLFVKEYLIDKNSARAARAAGYKGTSAATRGSQFLMEPEVQEAIAKGLEAQKANAGLTADMVIAELKKIAFTEMVKIRAPDKVRALELLSKHFGLLTEKIEVTGKDGGPQHVVVLPANGSEAIDES